MDFNDILDDRSQAYSKLHARQNFASEYDDKKDLDNSIDNELKHQRQDELILESKRMFLAKAMSYFVILKLKEIQIRRQYLSDVRFIDREHPQVGKKGSLVEYDDLIYHEPKFIDFVTQHKFPFANDVYLIRTGYKVPM